MPAAESYDTIDVFLEENSMLKSELFNIRSGPLFTATELIRHPACAANLRVTTIIGCFGTCAGAWLKVFSVPPDMFWLGFLGQTVVAISQVFVLNVPPRLAAVWFGEDQVSVACSIGVFGNQEGPLGQVQHPVVSRSFSTRD
ncbi:unnamed protein product [Arctia plantaginis]|uniref:Uncharacterized protein n=1 Tax=Arctia plantaginis TaxID=874455 RepID=A0A8S1A6F6_ARCPL|nr:unnamed protein product [Arctia plantaginis]